MATALYSLDKLRTPDEALLPGDTAKILEALKKKKKYFELVRLMEQENLAGNRFDDAFARLRDNNKISISETFVVSRK